MRKLYSLSPDECYDRLMIRSDLKMTSYQLLDPYTLQRLETPVLTPFCSGCQPMEYEVLEILKDIEGIVQCHTCGRRCMIEDLQIVSIFETMDALDSGKVYQTVFLYFERRVFAYMKNEGVYFPDEKTALQTLLRVSKSGDIKSLREKISRVEVKLGYIEMYLGKGEVSDVFFGERGCDHSSLWSFGYYWESGRRVDKCPVCERRIELTELEVFDTSRCEMRKDGCKLRMLVRENFGLSDWECGDEVRNDLINAYYRVREMVIKNNKVFSVPVRVRKG